MKDECVCKRFFYLLRMLLKKRACLKQFLSNSDDCLSRIEDLSPSYLIRFHIKLVALDFDGVLSSHGQEQPAESVRAWLTQLDKEFPLKQVCIYSNNLFDQRIQYLENAFPDIEIIRFTKKKPYPDDLLKIAEKRQLKPKAILVIDDRLTSGILSACLIGAKALLITKPFINYRAATIKELFFTAIRFIERKVIQWL
ncbi:YqeG family HAD IIIA-type phosphatase [Coxiella burnetii]|uniref:Hydrolase family protein n=1 Tax=Coxiella burnetii (strain RSA 493 / Nine Mile phase I) TaxID=227377 RepID=Q83DS9_COXBU|nr:hydrolase [Coxiella burnetii]NP_819646.1 hydrolase family protein [Coxiella burnetii RSA 493]AAO90160.1 hydrolase family protein [Coxiella burnetii RSA 493]ACJ18693.1 hydrolase family protein [Coxiella burnetii CbuG_Q212]AML49457.1 hydrolase [Coxiella burnetii]AML55373.1 hydrolase [Coxiella burnetii]ARI65483.1 hydrolase [Coxiella burnetii]